MALQGTVILFTQLSFDWPPTVFREPKKLKRLFYESPQFNVNASRYKYCESCSPRGPLHNYIVLLKTHLCHSIMGGGDKALICLQLFSTEQNASQKRLVFKVTPEIWL